MVIANQFFCMTLWSLMMHHCTKFGDTSSSSEDIVQKTLNKAIQSFHKTLRFMMVHHQTWYGSKSISNSEEIIDSHILIIWAFTGTLMVQKRLSWQMLTDILNLCCDLDLEHNNPISHKTFWIMMEYHQTKFGCKRVSSSVIVGRAIFWLYQPSL